MFLFLVFLLAHFLSEQLACFVLAHVSIVTIVRVYAIIFRSIELQPHIMTGCPVSTQSCCMKPVKCMVYIRSSKNGSEEGGSKVTGLTPGLLWVGGAPPLLACAGSKTLRKNASADLLVASPEEEHCSSSGLAPSLMTSLEAL